MAKKKMKKGYGKSDYDADDMKRVKKAERKVPKKVRKY